MLLWKRRVSISNSERSGTYEAARELFLSAPEQAWLRHRPDLTLEQRFYRAWTLKEALGKRAGQGWDRAAASLDLVAADGESGLAAALSGRYAIVVLDVMMPRLNGIEVLRRLHGHSQVPVLTVRGLGYLFLPE